jgi:hypothetical protein
MSATFQMQRCSMIPSGIHMAWRPRTAHVVDSARIPGVARGRSGWTAPAVAATALLLLTPPARVGQPARAGTGSWKRRRHHETR